MKRKRKLIRSLQRKRELFENCRISARLKMIYLMDRERERERERVKKGQKGETSAHLYCAVFREREMGKRAYHYKSFHLFIEIGNINSLERSVFWGGLSVVIMTLGC